MGSWSVYCSISRITITAGDDVVLIPLRNNTSHIGYDEYIPATLPIFGEYDDYGGIENIIKDENTKLLENYFNCTIEEFCKFFTRGNIRTDEDDFPKQLLDVEELKDWTYMWVDRKVFDFMSTHSPNIYGGDEAFDLGNKTILEKMGFEFIEKEIGKKRYNLKFKAPNGKIAYSDGRWLENSIYSLNDIEKKYNADTSYFRGKCQDKIYPIMDKKWCLENLGYVIGIRYDTSFDFDDTIFYKKGNNTLKVYQDNIMEDYILEQLSNLVSVKRNMYPMSTSWEPYVLYTTPQCGEHAAHQKLLEEFCKINASKIGDDEE